MMRRSCARKAGLLALALACAEFAAAATARADERTVPVPRVTIYPGNVIRENMLEERAFTNAVAPEETTIGSTSAIVGKIARRTLLPGKPIATIAVENAKAISVGAQVKIVFDEDGLVIVTYGMALQSGAVGERIRIRNQDSGLTVSGTIQADGSVRVSEG